MSSQTFSAIGVSHLAGLRLKAELYGAQAP